MKQNSLAGTIVDNRYSIVNEIGRGGMGIVYRAKHLGLGNPVAIKLISETKQNDQRGRARFKREAQLMAEVQHPHICEVIDYGVTEQDQPYLVLPFLTGRSLKEIIETDGPLEIQDALHVTSQLLEALAAVHCKNIVHRDVKPGNIFIINTETRRNFVKLLDFGVSKILGTEEVDTLTGSSSIPGTPHYMAPEQIECRKDLDHRIDIYAIGIVLYEMLTGTRPFEGESHNEVLAKILTKPFSPPSMLCPEIPKVLEQFILKTMARDPDARFSSAKEMLDEIAVLKERIVPSSKSATDSSATASQDYSAFNKGAYSVKNQGNSRYKPLLFAIGGVLICILGLVCFLHFGSSEKTKIAPEKIEAAITVTPTVTGSQEVEQAKPEIVSPTPVVPQHSEKANAETNVIPANKPKRPPRRKTKKIVDGRFGSSFATEYED